MAITLKEAYGLNGCGADQIRYVSLLDIGPSSYGWDNRPIFGGLQIGQNYQVVIGSVTYLEGASQGFTIREYDYLSNTAGRSWEVGTDGSTSNLILTITGATKGTLLIYAGRAGQTTGNKVRFTNCSLYSLGNITGNLLPNSGGLYYKDAKPATDSLSITYQNSGNTEVPEIKIVAGGAYAKTGIYFNTSTTITYNRIICQAGYTYNVSFWAFSNKSGTSNFIDPLEEGLGTAHGSSLLVPNGIWTKVWSTATITGGCNVVIGLKDLPLGVNTTFYVKDIRVTRCTPEDTYWMAWIPSFNSAEQNEKLPDIAEVNTLLDLHQNARSTYPFQNSLLNNPQTSLAWARGVNPVTGIQILANTASTENYSYSSYFNIPSNTKFYISFWAQCSANIKGADVYILPDDYTNKGLVVKDRLPLNQTWTLYRYEFTSPSTWGDSVPVRIRFDNNGSNDGNEARLYLKDVNISLDIDHSNELASWEGFKYQISSRTRTIDSTEWSYSGNVRIKGTLEQQKILYSDGSASDWTTLSSNSQSETAQYTDYGAWTYSDPKRTRTVTYRWSDGATNPGGTQTQTATTSTNYSAWTYSSDNSYRTRTATPVYTYTDTTRYGTATSQRENGTVSYGTWSYSGITRTRTVSYVYSDVTKTSNSQSETATLNNIVGEYTSSNPYNGNNQWTKAGGGTISVAVLGKYNFSDNVAAQQYVTNSCTYSYTNNNVGTWNASSHVMTINSAGTTIVGDSSANTLTITYSGKTISVVFKRQANAITGYGTPTGGSLTVNDIPASGGTISSGTIGGTVSQTRTYTSGSNDTYSQATPTNGTYSAGISGSNLGTIETSRTSKGTLTYSYTLNGKSGSISATVYQQANTWRDSDITLSVSSTTIGANGGTLTITPTVYRTYTSGAHSVGGSPSGTVSGSATGFTITNDYKLIVANRGTTVGAARSITLTATYAGLTSNSVTVTQAANSLTWNNPVITFSYPGDIPASGGTITPTVSITQSGSYSSGSPASNTTIASKSFSGTGVNASTGAYTASSLGTTVKPRTNLVTATVTVTANGKTGTKSADVYQAQNRLLNGDLNGSNSDFKATCTLLANQLTAAGGTATFGGSASHTHRYYTQYDSGTYGPYTKTVTDGISLSMVGNGNSRFSFANSVATHSNMGKNVTTDTVTIRCTNSANTSTHHDASASISNAVGAWVDTGITAYGTPSVSIGSGLTAAGGSATVSHSVSNTMGQKRTYTSGSYDTQSVSRAGTTTIAITTNGNSRFSLSGNTLSHSNMTSNVTTDTVVITAKNSGDTSKTKTATQSISNAVTGYNAPTIGAFTYPAGSISYSGGSQSPSYSIYQNLTYTSGTSALTRVDDNWYGGNNYSKGFSITGTGFSINYSTGVVTAASNSSTSTRSATVTMSINGRTSVILDKATATVTQAAKPGPQRVDISINDPMLAGGEVVLTFSPACYDTLTILVMGYLQEGSLYSVYRNVGGGITEDRFYPNGAWADSASIENVDGEATPPVTKTRGIYYW